ncbi:LysR family transcriptional regulator [Achromobacter xylosoxidans]|uniref:LysR family transcriptional regulator n=1 Tax=Achromobacter TaxID=222 RepID=UPI001E335E8C|nr:MULTISPECIES: LysR family transcriptional regulator [Achromobacter]MCH4579983.1 LysR family transcriptional regulator [Achromobacter xylosoxidans]
MSLFVEVARAMSFRRAAQALGMPSSTLSRRILALERAIGLRLLHRSTRQIELTEAGQIYFERSQRIVEEARLAHEQLGEIVSQPQGVLRVSLPVDFAIMFLARCLPEFGRRYPSIQFEFDLTPRRVDLVAEPFDVAIRMGQLPDSHLIGRKIAEVPRLLYASQDYLDVHGEPKVPDDLSQHQCLLFPNELSWTLRQDAVVREVPVDGRFRLNNVGMMQRLAMEGLGIAMLAKEGALMAMAEDSHSLQPVLPEWRPIPIAVHAITETRLLPAKTQRFIEYLKEQLTYAT